MRKAIFGLFARIAVSLLCVTSCQDREPAGQPAPAPAAGWQVIGPGGGGSMFTPRVSPFDPDHALLHCDMTGGYVTRDGGRSWRMFNLRTTIADFVFDPVSPGAVYAFNSGLYRSEDGGDKWELVYPRPEEIIAERMVLDHGNHSFETGDSLTRYSAIQAVCVDPADGNSIYAGWRAMSVSRDSLAAVFLSDSVTVIHSPDRGASWRKLAVLAGRQVVAIYPGSWWGNSGAAVVITERGTSLVSAAGAVGPAAPLPSAAVYAASAGRGDRTAVIYLACEAGGDNGGLSGGLYRSDDGGSSWQQCGLALFDTWKATGRAPYFNTVETCRNYPDNVYLSVRAYWQAGGEQPVHCYGIARSRDGGDNWEWVYFTDERTVTHTEYRGGWMLESYGPEWTGNPHGLGVSPADPEVCYTADWGRASRTVDGGKTWEQIYGEKLPDGGWTTRGLDVTTCYGVHFDPFDPQHMFISYTDIGLFNSFSGGKSWLHSLNGVPEPWWNTCYWVEFDPQVRDRIWSVWGNGHDLPRLKMWRRPGFVDRFQGGVAVSADGGRSWQPQTSGIPANTVCTHVVIDPASPADARTIYVCGAGRGVFKSTDSGESWRLLDRGIGPNRYTWRITRLPDGELLLIVMRALDDHSRVLPGALYRSSDGGENWQPVDLPAGVTGPNDLVADPHDPDRLYLSCWPQPDERANRGGGLLVSEDRGRTWRRIFREDAHVYAAAVDPDNPQTIIIATFDSALFRSDDGGENWYRLKGFTFKWGHRPEFDPHHPGMLYVTTFGGSVFYGPAAGTPAAPEEITNFTDQWRWGVNY